MDKINFTDLNLKVDDSFFEETFNDVKIKVRKYLPCIDKYNLIMTTLNESYEDGIYNSYKLDLFFHLNLILGYTNLDFDNINFENSEEENFKNIYDIYDEMKSSGFMDFVVSIIPDDEYTELWAYLVEISEIMKDKEMSITNNIERLINKFPDMVNTMSNFAKNFNQEDFKNVIDFANYANGNRDISTNISTLPISDKAQD